MIQDLYIKGAAASGGVSSTLLMQTNQLLSYRTGDDGDFEYGRAVDFYTLASNNPFGNTSRFTDTLGTQVYANDIVLDWSNTDGTTIVSGLYRVRQAQASWADAIDNCLAFSVPGFTSGWYLPNMIEMVTLWRIGARGFHYVPLNQGNNNDRYWSSTTLTAYTNQPLFVANPFQCGGVPDSQLYYQIPFRRFTYTELGV